MLAPLLELPKLIGLLLMSVVFSIVISLVETRVAKGRGNYCSFSMEIVGVGRINALTAAWVWKP